MTTTLKAFLASGLLLASSVATAETIERDICVFDIAGKVGPTMAAMQDWRTEAMNWGLDANLKVYTNESVVAEDLKAGVCDAALMTGIRARQFNTYAGTLDSIGAIPTMEHMKIALQVLAHPNSADKLTANSYEVMGIAPIGAAYIFVNDRLDCLNLLHRGVERVSLLRSGERITLGRCIAVEHEHRTPALARGKAHWWLLLRSGLALFLLTTTAIHSTLELHMGNFAHNEKALRPPEAVRRQRFLEVRDRLPLQIHRG